MSKTDLVQNPGDLWIPEFLPSPRNRKILLIKTASSFSPDEESKGSKSNSLKARFGERTSVDPAAMWRHLRQHYGCWNLPKDTVYYLKLTLFSFFFSRKDSYVFVYISKFSKQYTMHKNTYKRYCTLPNEISSHSFPVIYAAFFKYSCASFLWLQMCTLEISRNLFFFFA